MPQRGEPIVASNVTKPHDASADGSAEVATHTCHAGGGTVFEQVWAFNSSTFITHWHSKHWCQSVGAMSRTCVVHRSQSQRNNTSHLYLEHRLTVKLICQADNLKRLTYLLRTTHKQTCLSSRKSLSTDFELSGVEWS